MLVAGENNCRDVDEQAVVVAVRRLVVTLLLLFIIMQRLTRHVSVTGMTNTKTEKFCSVGFRPLSTTPNCLCRELETFYLCRA